MKIPTTVIPVARDNHLRGVLKLYTEYSLQYLRRMRADPNKLQY